MAQFNQKAYNAALNSHFGLNKTVSVKKPKAPKKPIRRPKVTPFNPKTTKNYPNA